MKHVLEDGWTKTEDVLEFALATIVADGTELSYEKIKQQRDFFSEIAREALEVVRRMRNETAR